MPSVGIGGVWETCGNQVTMQAVCGGSVVVHLPPATTRAWCFSAGLCRINTRCSPSQGRNKPREAPLRER